MVSSSEEYRCDELEDESAEDDQPEYEPGHQQQPLPGTQAVNSEAAINVECQICSYSEMAAFPGIQSDKTMAR